jgi:hypothetical protein
VFGNPYPGAYLQLYRKFSETSLLPNVIRDELEGMPFEAKLHFYTTVVELDGELVYGRPEVHPSVEATLRNFFRVETLTMGQFLAPLSEEAIRDLRVCEVALQEGRPPQIIDVTALLRLSSLLSDAVELVRTTTQLELSTAEFLLVRLRDLQDAVDLIRVRGARGVQVAAEALVGGLSARGDVVNESQRSVLLSILSRIRSVLTTVALLTGAVNGSYDLEAHLDRMIALPPASTVVQPPAPPGS